MSARVDMLEQSLEAVCSAGTAPFGCGQVGEQTRPGPIGAYFTPQDGAIKLAAWQNRNRSR